MFDVGRFNVGPGHHGTHGDWDPVPSRLSPYWPGEFSPAGYAVAPGEEDATQLLPDSPEEPVASAKLKAVGPPASGLSVGEREMAYQNMSPEEREEKKKKHQVSSGLEMDPAVWDFIYITRNQMKIVTDLIRQMIALEWMTEPEAEKWRELCCDSINRGQKQLTGGGAVLCFGPLRRSRLTFEVNEEKSTQFYRKIRIYAGVYFQKPLDKDTIAADPSSLSEPDEEMLAFMAEFGGLADDEPEPPDFTEVWTEDQDDDAERAKWTRASVEQNPRDWFRQIKGDKKAEKREQKEQKQFAAKQRQEEWERKQLALSQDDAPESDSDADSDAPAEPDSGLTPKERWVRVRAKLSVAAQVWKVGGRDKSEEIPLPGLMPRLEPPEPPDLLDTSEPGDDEIESAAQEASEQAALRALARAKVIKAGLKRVRVRNEQILRGEASPQGDADQG
ncbi:MAG: hypothetical protein GC200_01555 [Tepidisphaera sp.]|nr:hypothetical protein [Tepidisphaera sp.]